MTDLSPDNCTCYECIGPIYDYDKYGRYLANNLKHHTLGHPCEQCGRPKSKHRDLGTKGYYECWFCDGPGFTDETGHTPPDYPSPLQRTIESFRFNYAIPERD